MAVNQIFRCDKCRSEGQSEEYRLNQDNFHQLTVSFYKLGSGGPMMPGQPTVGNRNETFQICSECKAAMDLALDGIVNPLKA